MVTSSVSGVNLVLLKSAGIDFVAPSVSGVMVDLLYSAGWMW